MPDDTEFVEAFSTKAVYSMNAKNKIYILERIENSGTAEDKDVYGHCDDGTYSIEHIMPQHLTPQWIKALGEDYEQIHEAWLHRIANLTLTAYNSKYSNNSFDEKKKMKNGFADSGIRMNTYIASKDKWTLAELEDRNSHLMAKALEIWPLPQTDFKPSEKQLDSCTLEDDVNLNGRKIAKYSYKNMEQPVSSWIDMFERVLKMLHAEDKSVLTKLAYETNPTVDLAAYVSNRQSDLRGALEIDDGIFVERNTSTELKLSLMRRFFKCYGADASDLVFFLRDENDTDEDISGTRHELRKRYWAYALEYIKEAHGDSGSFRNVNPSKENWINGFFGIGGFCISCIANYDVARVELVLGNGNKDKNKKAFDYLYARKAEIEKGLGGVLLQWARHDDTKASYVVIRLENVSIESEADWLQMAKFHAEWSKRFYDVIVPYLKEMK